MKKGAEAPFFDSAITIYLIVKLQSRSHSSLLFESVINLQIEKTTARVIAFNIITFGRV